jgi:hypothetical protein
MARKSTLAGCGEVAFHPMRGKRSRNWSRRSANLGWTAFSGGPFQIRRTSSHRSWRELVDVVCEDVLSRSAPSASSWPWSKTADRDLWRWGLTISLGEPIDCGVSVTQGRFTALLRCEGTLGHQDRARRTFFGEFRLLLRELYEAGLIESKWAVTRRRASLHKNTSPSPVVPSNHPRPDLWWFAETRPLLSDTQAPDRGGPGFLGRTALLSG